jgi:hypothetical protein
MKFTYKGNIGITIEFEDSDTDNDKRMIEQGMAFIRNTLENIQDIRTLAIIK